MPLSEEDIEVALRNQIRRDAQKRVGAKLGFYWHFAVFAVTNLAMLTLNMLYSPSYLWFLWPFFGWGLGLAAHAFVTFQAGGGREAMIEAEVQREMARRGLK